MNLKIMLSDEQCDATGMVPRTEFNLILKQLDLGFSLAAHRKVVGPYSAGAKWWSSSSPERKCYGFIKRVQISRSMPSIVFIKL